MDRNHLEDKEDRNSRMERGVQVQQSWFNSSSSITKDRVGADSTIKEGFIQQTPSLRRIGRKWTVGWKIGLLPLPLGGRMERLDSRSETPQRVGWKGWTGIEKSIT